MSQTEISGVSGVDPKPRSYLPLIALLCLIVVIWATSGWFLHGEKERGTFGDMFGAVNALFSGLAFASLVYTILLQKEELQLQRTELTLTRQELAGQRAELKQQNSVLATQNFESTFFQLLRLLNDTVSSMDYRDSSGRDCFLVFWKEVQNTKARIVPSSLAAVETEYLRVYRSHETDLGHYFRTLYNIVKFVHESPIANKAIFMNFLRAQLSAQELLLLFYNGVSIHGRDKFKPLIEQYSLLKHVPKQALLDTSNQNWYQSSAFGTAPKLVASS
jgi:Putative phage abortive infection protein